MSTTRRNAGWYLEYDRAGFLRYHEGELDRIDIEVDAIRRLRHEETKARLERLGFDVSNFQPPPPLQAWEQHCSRWPTDRDVIEYEMRRNAAAGERQRQAMCETVDEATGQVTRELVGPIIRLSGQVLGVR